MVSDRCNFQFRKIFSEVGFDQHLYQNTYYAGNTFLVRRAVICPETGDNFYLKVVCRFWIFGTLFVREFLNCYWLCYACGCFAKHELSKQSLPNQDISVAVEKYDTKPHQHSTEPKCQSLLSHLL